jgi:uncharacterized membrane protein (TIGR02234 family)
MSQPAARMKSGLNRYRELAAALLAIVIGAALALLLTGITWQTISAPRPRPAADVLRHVSGRDLQAVIAGLAIVALAGAVAVLATRGIAKRLVGVLIALAGLAIVWRASLGFAAVGTGRARTLLNDGLNGADIGTGITPHVQTHAIGPAVIIVAGLLVAFGGAIVAVRAPALSTMSGRYEAPTKAAESERDAGPASDLAVWKALDRGDDPTIAAKPDEPPDVDSRTDPTARIRTEP